MIYDDARPLMKSGDIIAFRHNNVASRIIRAATGSDYSHVGVVWPVAGRVMILEAVIPKIRIFPLSKLLPFYWVSCNRPLTLEAEEYALSRVGEDYSITEAIFGYFGLAGDNKKWQCAEFVMSVLKNNGIDLPGKETPAEVVLGILRQNAHISIVQR
jgi:hypothetical protein